MLTHTEGTQYGGYDALHTQCMFRSTVACLHVNSVFFAPQPLHVLLTFDGLGVQSIIAIILVNKSIEA